MISKRRFIQGTLLATLLPIKFQLLAEGVTMQSSAESAIQNSIAEIIREYAEQGIHRTGTDVDNQSADWLMQKIEMLDVAATDTAFEFQRLQPITTQLSIADAIVLGEPLYDCQYTDGSGITGSIGELGSHADIGVIMALPFDAAPNVRLLYEARKAAQHKAIVVVTDSQLPEEGAALLNAEDFTAPFGPPVLQVANKHWAAIQAAIKSTQQVGFVLHCEYVKATARNVEAKVEGSRPELAPVVVMTPRSGWWLNASERGGGIACFLEIMRAVKSSAPKRDVIFTANTGHELGHTGLSLFLDNNPTLIKQAHIWIHLGANFAAKFGSQVRLQYSDVESVASLEPWLKQNGLTPSAVTPIGQRPLGEARNVYDGQGRFVSILGGNGLFHHPADRWPEAVDLTVTTNWVTAFTQLAVAEAGNSNV
jgi:hypothetical protein|tara:strand:+ start:1288 stop:2556 length:1269 start_codon:yes stop_codon:yes gene_type:complete